MSLEVYPNVSREITFEHQVIERVILQLADLFDIRLLRKYASTIITGTFALAGGLIGSVAGGKVGAAVGAGIGGSAGLGLSSLVSLRDIWDSVKEDLKELIFIVLNYLRTLNPDYVRAIKILMGNAARRMELAMTLLEFIAYKLGCAVFSNIASAHQRSEQDLIVIPGCALGYSNY